MGPLINKIRVQLHAHTHTHAYTHTQTTQTHTDTITHAQIHIILTKRYRHREAGTETVIRELMHSMMPHSWISVTSISKALFQPNAHITLTLRQSK